MKNEMASSTRDLTGYTIGWIAPMPKELAAAASAVLETGSEMLQVEGRTYRVGEIGQHHVVMTVPSGIGQLAARSTADAMVRAFKRIKHVLVVGIAGGVPCYGPDGERQIVLGDVVVSSPGFGEGGIKQYDVGAITNEGFIESGHTDKPSPIWLEAVNNLRTDHMSKESAIPQLLQRMRDQIMVERHKFEDPGDAADRVFNDDYPHRCQDKSCDTCCDITRSRTRQERGNDALRNVDAPVIHYGNIGSGNSLVISSQQRNALASRFGILCFEMESAGIADGYHCLVIRGICDYADSHKNKKWQEYAALTAAAYAREVLKYLPSSDVNISHQTDAASFSIALFRCTCSAFVVFTAGNSLGDHSGVVQAQLRIQEELLREWGHGLGLSKDGNEIDERLQTESSLFRNVVVTLGDIKRNLLDVNGLKQQYGLAPKQVTNEHALPSSLQDLGTLADGEMLLANRGLRIEDIEITNRRISILRQLEWVIEDKSKIAALVALLSKVNNDLYNLVSPSDARMFTQAATGKILRTTDVHRLRNIEIAAQVSNRNIAALATRKHHTSVAARTPTEILDMKLPGGMSCLRIRSTTSNGSRSLGTYQHQEDNVTKSVIIEWKYVSSRISTEERNVVDKSMNTLAYILRQDQHSSALGNLACLGTTGIVVESDEHKKGGLVYSLPDGVDDQKLPVSLFEILPDNDDNSSHKEFDLGDKFRVAQMLTQSTYELLVSNWFHKSIRSDNVSFFQPRSSLLSRKPRNFSTSLAFLTGYEFARPGGLRDPTQKAGGIKFDLYAHPSYRSGSIRYNRMFDIYSLGVVLLEIGIWKRVESGVKPDQTPESVQKLLVQACCEELGPTMGKPYLDAVLFCLGGDSKSELIPISSDPEPDWAGMRPEEVTKMEAENERLNARIIELFYWKVVGPLSKLYAG